MRALCSFAKLRTRRARAEGRWIGTVEPLEDVLEVLLVEPGPRVRDSDLCRAVPARHGDGRRRAGRGMGADVREEVVDDLPEPVAVSDDDRGLAVELDRALGIDRLGRLDSLADDVVQSHRLALERPAVVEPGEEQEVVDEKAHPLRLATDAPHRALEVVGALGGAPVVELGVRADSGPRRAELVRGVGDEASELPLRRRLRAERLFDPAEHRVQGEPETADLGALLCPLDPSREVAGGDRRGRLPDRVEGLETETDEPQAERDDRPEHDQRHDELDEEKPLERRVDVAERRRDDEHRLVALGDGGARAVPPAVLPRNGEVAHELALPALRVRRRDRGGHRRRRDALAGKGRAGKCGDGARPVERAHLDERSGRRESDAAARARAAQRMGGLLEGRVRPVVEERAQRRVRRDVRGEQAHDRDRDDRQDEPRAQRQALRHGYDASSM